MEVHKGTMNPESRDSIPSLVSDSYWVFCRSSKERNERPLMDETEEDFDPLDDLGNDTVGKWILFLNKKVRDSDGLTELDKAWSKVKELVTTKDLYSAKCSTGMPNPNSFDDSKGVVICYSSDYTNKSDVKKSADAIRKVVNYRSAMYYKTDTATTTGQYQVFGKKNVSLYRHDINGDFYIKESEKWKPIPSLELNN